MPVLTQGDIPAPSTHPHLQEATHDSHATRPQRRGLECGASSYTISRGRLLGHRRRLRPRPGHRRPLVPLHGGAADRAQGHLGLPAQAAPGHRPPDQGRRGDGAVSAATSSARSPITPSAPGPPASPGCPPAGAGTHWFTRAWPSSASSGTTSCCWPRTRPTRRGCTTASWTGAAPCPCTAPGGTGSGGGGWTPSETVPLESAGLLAYTCNPKGEELKADLSAAVAAGTLTLNADDGTMKPM